MAAAGPKSPAQKSKSASPAGKTGSGTMTCGGALLSRLKALGIDYIFANSGTDFPPIIEGLAEAAASGIDLPESLVIPHESAAMGMAHGYYLATGKTAAVMAHTNVGLANCSIGAINAATEHVPVLLFSGRTPTTEKDRFGSRTVPIGWGQEMRDQTALVREASKWDYELRFPEQAVETADRAKAIAETAPRGPVYVSLPREVLCEPTGTEQLDLPPIMRPARPGLSDADFETAAKWLAEAENPVIFAQHGAGGPDGFAALSELAEKWGIPVCQYWAVQCAIDSDHPMAAAAPPAPLLEKADVILVIDCLAPWAPDAHGPRPGAKVIHLAQDPLFSRVPVRNFQCDLALAADVEPGLLALKKKLEVFTPSGREEARRRFWADTNAGTRQKAIASAKSGERDPMTKSWVSLCLSEALAGRDASVLSELGCPMDAMSLTHAKAWFQEPHSGGLGWSFPAALGMKIGAPERTIVATMGDGSYIFSNPVACHQIAEAHRLPILLVILNNAEWGAVRQSVLGLYPDGHAARSNQVPLTGLSPVPDFAMIARASRAHAQRVEHGADLPGAIEAALKHIDEQGTMALLDVQVAP
ncbi:thiamine pyrophosphate-requiring protein [uncultured Roseibium sp.]|uniref:thiamine pyrophosphate-requiring protein n=1 Tax=uncultured Roseibium sp. TaxID=1936171 RepID=UPI00345DAAC1